MKLPPLRLLRSDLASVLSSRVMGMLFQLVTFAVLARAATPGPMGHYSTTYSYALVGIGLSDLGVQSLLGREYAVEALREWGAKAYWLQALFTGIAASALALVLALTQPDGLVTMLIPVQVFVEIQQACTLSLALAAGHATVQVRTMFLSRFPVFLVMLGVMVSPLRGDSAVLAYLVAAIACTAAAVLWVLKYLGILAHVGIPSDWRDIVKQARHFLLSSVSWQVRQLDTALVGFAANAHQAGFYAVPARLVGPLRLFDTSITAVVVPYVRRGEGGRVRKFSKLMVVATLGMCLAFAVVSVFLSPLVRVTLGASYLPAVMPLRIMLAATAALMAANYITAVIQAAGRERFVGNQGSALAALFLVLVPLGAHVAGASGAAVGVLVINFLQFVTSLVPARSVFRDLVRADAHPDPERPQPEPHQPEPPQPEPLARRALVEPPRAGGNPDPRPRRAAD